MTCSSATGIITRWLEGDRKQPIQNMIGAAERHVHNCGCEDCAKNQQRLAGLPVLVSQ